MKVLLVQKMAGISGSERYFLNILPALRQRGIDAGFLVVQHPRNAHKNNGFVDELQQAGVPVHVINARLSLSPLLILRMWRLIRRERIDLLQTNLIHADVWGGIVKFLFMPGLPIVSVKHGYCDPFQARYGLNPAYLRTDMLSLASIWAARFANRVISISGALSSFLTQGKLVPAAKAGVIPYGFDFSNVTSLVAPGGLRFGNPQIVVAGRLVAVKQHHFLLQILPKLVAEFPGLSVVMVGAGPLLDTLKAQAESLGVGAHVRWEGFRNNMHDYIRDSDVMVVPSSAEGFGLVVLEAWHHARPVVAFDVPAINEIVSDGGDGYLIPAFDTEKLFACLNELLRDPLRVAELGKAGQEKLAEKYGIAAMCERTIQVFQEVCAEARLGRH